MNIVLRKAVFNDIESLIRLRIDYLVEDKGNLTIEEEIAIKEQLSKFFKRHISDETFIGILAEIDGDIVSTAYLIISERPANPAFLTGITGIIMNVLTYPEYRRNGIATKVIEKLIEEAKNANISSIELMATSDGKPLYEKMGFKESEYVAMRLSL